MFGPDIKKHQDVVDATNDSIRTTRDEFLNPDDSNQAEFTNSSIESTVTSEFADFMSKETTSVADIAKVHSDNVSRAFAAGAAGKASDTAVNEMIARSTMRSHAVVVKDFETDFDSKGGDGPQANDPVNVEAKPGKQAETDPLAVKDGLPPLPETRANAGQISIGEPDKVLGQAESNPIVIPGNEADAVFAEGIVTGERQALAVPKERVELAGALRDIMSLVDERGELVEAAEPAALLAQNPAGALDARQTEAVAVGQDKREAAGVQVDLQQGEIVTAGADEELEVVGAPELAKATREVKAGVQAGADLETQPDLELQENVEPELVAAGEIKQAGSGVQAAGESKIDVRAANPDKKIEVTPEPEPITLLNKDGQPVSIRAQSAEKLEPIAAQPDANADYAGDSLDFSLQSDPEGDLSDTAKIAAEQRAKDEVDLRSQEVKDEQTLEALKRFEERKAQQGKATSVEPQPEPEKKEAIQVTNGPVVVEETRVAVDMGGAAVKPEQTPETENRIEAGTAPDKVERPSLVLDSRPEPEVLTGPSETVAAAPDSEPEVLTGPADTVATEPSTDAEVDTRRSAPSQIIDDFLFNGAEELANIEKYLDQQAQKRGPTENPLAGLKG